MAANGGDGAAPDWPGLLKWSLQYQDGTSTEPKRELTQEDRDFLESAMKEGVLDIAKTLKEIAATLSSHEDKSTEEVVSALDQLQELCIDLDTALDLEVIGGVQILAKLCTPTQQPDVQRAASEVVATVAQNNPRGQAAMVQEGFVPELMTLIKTSEDARVAKAGLWALSSICRGLPGGSLLFLSHDGFAAIEHCLKMGNSALNGKSIHIVRAFALEDPEHALPKVPHIQGLAQVLAQLIDNAEDDIGPAEAAISVVAQLVASKDTHLQAFAQEMGRASQVGLGKALDKIVNSQAGVFSEETLEEARAILEQDDVIN